MTRFRRAVLPASFAIASVVLVVATVKIGPLGLAAALVAAAALCAMLASRASMGGLGIALVLGFTFTASYDDKVAGVASPRQLFLVLGGAVLALAVATRRSPRIPWWILVFAGTAVTVTFLQTVFPISPEYLASRYASSSFGQSLGERGSAALALASFLLNVVGVPTVVILAVMHRRKALVWIIAAYVAGVCLSALAGFLGFIGQPILLKPMNAVIPPHVRALGYTSFPLRFGTTIVFALPMACWLAGRRPRWSRWGGRVAILVLLLGVYASGSRAAVVSAMVCLGLAVLFLPELRRRTHVIASAVAIVLAGVIWTVPGLGDTILQTTRLTASRSTDVSDQGRGEVFAQGVSDLRHSPLYGIGVRYIAEAHLTYLGVLAAGGAILFLGFVFLNVGAIRTARATARVDPALGGMALTSIGTALAYWFVGIDFAVASVQVMYGVIAAAAIHAGLPESIDASGLSPDSLVVLPHAARMQGPD